MKKLLLFSSIIIILIAIIIVVSFLPQGKKGPQKEAFPTPTLVKTNQPTPPPRGASPGVSAETDPKTIKQNKQAYQVGLLLDVLPYAGINFSMSYDYNEDVFRVVFRKDNISSSEKEFNEFLQKNGIEDKNWIQSLVITYQ